MGADNGRNASKIVLNEVLKPGAAKRLVHTLAALFGALGGLVLAMGLLLLALVALPPPPRPVNAISGTARAIDGDTLAIGAARIRLIGLDAPERKQTCTRPNGAVWSCGTEAGARLAALVAGQQVQCALAGRDRYRRDLARCRVPQGDLGAILVREGWAVADGAYLDEASYARAARLGIWSGTFEQPRDVRRRAGFAVPGCGLPCLLFGPIFD